jgi:hypothetical protein
LPIKGEPPKRIEAEIATTFRHFAMMEKDKLHAKKQALQKKEKDGRLAELKAFHQSFKLNVPIPADLVPLLSKGKKPTENVSEKSEPSELKTTSVVQDKKKPVPAVASATKAASATTSPASNTAPTAASPSSATSTNTTAASPTPANANSFKFNVKASSFKPNPSAAAFVPGGSTTVEHNEPHQNNLYGGRSLKKQTSGPGEHLTMTEAFSPSFVDAPNSVGPTWPFGHKSYRVQFSQMTTYEDDVYTGYPSPNYGYGYSPYRYPQVCRHVLAYIIC